MSAESIAEFIRGEVMRQGFTPGTESFDKRCHWMGQAWTYAVTYAVEASEDRDPNVKDISNLGGIVEPEKNRHGFRTVGVMVGCRICPRAEDVPLLMRSWVATLLHLTPDENYLKFEKIHPFVDGNGRVGKIIHNWLNKTLDEPVLVQDFFGHGIP